MKEQVFQIRTAGFGFIDNKLLLIKHNKNNKKYWVVPGGRVEFGEKSLDTIKREFLEELNVKIEVVKFLFYNESIPPNYPYHNINLFFLIKFLDNKFNLGSEPILDDYKFFAKKDIADIKLYPEINKIIYDNFDIWLNQIK